MKTAVPGKLGKLGAEGWLGREGDREEAGSVPASRAAAAGKSALEAN